MTWQRTTNRVLPVDVRVATWLGRNRSYFCCLWFWLQMLCTFILGKPKENVSSKKFLMRPWLLVSCLVFKIRCRCEGQTLNMSSIRRLILDPEVAKTAKSQRHAKMLIFECLMCFRKLQSPSLWPQCKRLHASFSRNWHACWNQRSFRQSCAVQGECCLQNFIMIVLPAVSEIFCFGLSSPSNILSHPSFNLRLSSPQK